MVIFTAEQANIAGSVVIITGIRIHALHDVTSADFTYSRNSLGLLSALGVFIAIILSGALAIGPLLRRTKPKRIIPIIGPAQSGIRKCKLLAESKILARTRILAKSKTPATSRASSVNFPEIKAGSPGANVITDRRGSGTHLNGTGVASHTNQSSFGWSYRMAHSLRLENRDLQHDRLTSWRDSLQSRDGSDPILFEDFQWLMQAIKLPLARYMFWDSHRPILLADLRCPRIQDENLEPDFPGSISQRSSKSATVDLFATFTNIVPGSPPQYIFKGCTILRKFLRSIKYLPSSVNAEDRVQPYPGWTVSNRGGSDVDIEAQSQGHEVVEDAKSMPSSRLIIQCPLTKTT